MQEDTLENLMILIGNLILFGAIWYAVFILGHSGWWFALILVIHFKSRKDKEVEEKE